MLRIYRRHQKRCKLTSKADPSCPAKVKCPVWITGTLANGSKVPPRSLNTRNWGLAAEIALKMESGKDTEPAPVTIKDGIELFLMSKASRSGETVRKHRLICGRLRAFCEARKAYAVEDIHPATLIRFRDTWTGADTSRRRDQENLRQFFRFCVRMKWIADNPAEQLGAIEITTPQTEVFELEEIDRIFSAARNFPDEYGRRDQPIADQVYAFVMVMRYTGLSIGDVAGLPKSAVQKDRILTQRYKTGKEVYVRVPESVVAALKKAPHDSREYFFWSGAGKIHTRSSKWNTRLQKLFVLADVRVGERQWNAKSLRSSRERPLMRPYSEADPRWFRHTLARDLLENDIVSMAELAEILGNSEAVCRKHYSKWDRRRQARIDEKLGRFWDAVH